MNESNTPLPQRAPANSSAPAQRATGFERAASAVRTVLPLLLPLLDGNFVTAAATLLAPKTPAPTPAPPVNLEAIEDGQAQLQAEHLALGAQIGEQKESLQRVEGQLRLLGEACDRHAVAQEEAAVARQEMMDELKAVGLRMEECKAESRKARLMLLAVLAVLALSVAANAFLVLHLRRFLP